jgi:hypothetical protein
MWMLVLPVLARALSSDGQGLPVIAWSGSCLA